MKQILIVIIVNFVFYSACQAQKKETIDLKNGEEVWSGIVKDGHLMPLAANYDLDFSKDNKSNQLQPLILTSEGRYIWSEKPFRFEFNGETVVVTDDNEDFIAGKAGSTLAEAHLFVRNNFFPPSGLMPDSLLFTAPQYNTWIELNFNQNQDDIIKYAQGIIDNGLPPGVIMIDDTWQEDYGVWNFHPGRFHDPKAMIDRLHNMGFKVMLWICPFVSPDQSVLYRKLREEKAFLLEKSNADDTWDSAEYPLMVRWWNGVSAVLDFSNQVAVSWFSDELERLTKDYGVDGFKFDAGDMNFYPENGISKGDYSANMHCEAYAQFGLEYPLNEYRACWKMGNQALAQRLHDKGHSWEDLQKLIPQMIVEGLSGYTFSCPDMIGGGLLSTFEDDAKIDEELVVRSAQCHAFMPMMQFSVAPWRVLSKINFTAVQKAVRIREKFTPLIMERARESAKTGEPILSNLEFHYPHKGYQSVVDQFMIGSEMMVAPVLEKGAKSRNVIIPPGKWFDWRGNKIKGPKTITVEVTLDEIPYYSRLK